MAGFVIRGVESSGSAAIVFSHVQCLAADYRGREGQGVLPGSSASSQGQDILAGGGHENGLQRKGHKDGH
jgi:hypothetical protein